MNRPDAGGGSGSRPALVWAVPTATGWWLLVLALALLAAGRGLAPRVVGAGLLVDAGLLLACVLAVSLTAAWGAALVTSPRPRLSGPDEVPAGHQAAWELAVGARLLRTAPRDVAWALEGTAAVSAPVGTRTPVLDGSSALPLHLEDRGSLRVRARRLSLEDPLGLARGHRLLRAEGTAVVLPRAMRLPDEVLAALTSGACGEGPLDVSWSRGAGQSSDLRPYRPGDPVASIHWRQSARLDTLLVTEREGEERPRVVLDLDTRPASYTAPAGRGAVEGRDDQDDRADSGSRPAGRRTGSREPSGSHPDRERAVRLAAALLTELEARGTDVLLLLDGRSVPVPGHQRAARGTAGDPADGTGTSSALRALALLPRPEELPAALPGSAAPGEEAPDGREADTAPVAPGTLAPSPGAGLPAGPDLLVTGPALLSGTDRLPRAGTVLVVSAGAVRVAGEGTR